MATQVFDTPGVEQFDCAGKKDVSFAIWSSGGPGGAADVQDCGGGGGGGYVEGSIPNEFVYQPAVPAIVLEIFLPDTSTEADFDTWIGLPDDSFVSVAAGGPGGDTSGGTAGSLVLDDESWVTVSRTGGTGGTHPSGIGTSAGSGGGSSAGTAAGGNNGVAGDTDGVAPGAGGAAVTGGGAGGAGGALTAAGTAGSSPGGGGGGAGDQYSEVGEHAPGGNAKVAITYSAVTVPSITSNGGGPTAAVNVAENTTAVTTVTTSGDADITGMTLAITGGADGGFFDFIDNGDGTGILAFTTPPDFENPADTGANNTYVVEVTATNAGGTAVQTITVTVTDEEGELTLVTLKSIIPLNISMAIGI